MQYSKLKKSGSFILIAVIAVSSLYFQKTEVSLASEITANGSTITSLQASPFSLSGVEQWNNPSFAGADDGLFTNANIDPVEDGISEGLIVKGFNFNFGPGVTIDGIEVTVERRASATSVGDYRVLLMSGSTLIGNNKSGVAQWSTTLETVTYGGATDKWGTTIDRNVVNSPNFGVAIAAEVVTGSSDKDVYIDYVSMKVYYTQSYGYNGMVNFSSIPIY